ncbi:MAG: ABC transporter ATP-binding protein [Bacteroidota bacterium]|jgi:ATP-binding cassette subfamily B protein|nr:ABC transporter ATP-binding protein [Ignavibacteria bacterium]MCU7512253.1 ABC transporter ATP-binding protein [Ignavibacteria bacterium]
MDVYSDGSSPKNKLFTRFLPVFFRFPAGCLKAVSLKVVSVEKGFKIINKIVVKRFKELKEWGAVFRNIPKFVRLSWKGNPRLIITGLALRVLYSILPIAILFLGKLIVDEVIMVVQEGQTHPPTQLIVYISIDFFLYIASSFVNRGLQANNRLVSEFYVNHSSIMVMEHAAELDLDKFENPEFYDKLHRVRFYSQARADSLIDIFDQAQDTVIFIFLLLGIITFNPWLVLLLILTSIPSLLSEFYFNRENYCFIEESTPEKRELEYLSEISTSSTTVKEVKAFGLSDFFLKQFRILSGRHYERKKIITFKRTRWSLFFSFLSSLGYYGSYIIVVASTIRGAISVGGLTFFFGSFEYLKEILEASFDRISKIAQNSLHIRDYFDFLNIKPLPKTKESFRPFPKPVLFGFTFQDVGFKYNGSDKWIIRHLSFSISPKEKLAIVGENGAGKTTITKLLCRLYDPTEGTIYLDGHDIKEYDPDELRKEIGIIFQDFNRYQMTVADNIAVGKIEQRDNLEMIKHSAQNGMADKFIDKLPSGYNQHVGKRYSKGIELSGGQWQKLALSRTFMRNAQLVILDEPSASLDPKTEYELFQRYIKHTQDKMVVLISHRFSNVRIADRIMVLDKGVCAEIGTHSELLGKKGIYADMFNLQAQGYK